MKKDRYGEGRFTAQGKGLGTVTEEMVRQRARELAVINGRAEGEVNESDLSQARKELTGGERLNPNSTPEEDLSEEERWEPVSGSTGDRVQAVPAPDEQTFAEKLVNEGLADAEHDQMVKASRNSLKKDRAGDDVL